MPDASHVGPEPGQEQAASANTALLKLRSAEQRATAPKAAAERGPAQHVCILGLGYVGLPTAAMLAVNGFRVIGVDAKHEVVDRINSGDVPIDEVGLKTLVQAAVGSGNLRAQPEPGPADVFIIAVPTPIKENRAADLSYVEQAARSIVPHLRAGNLVVLESTVPPGTTAGMLVSILSESGLKPGEGIFVAHCPERVLPGRILAELVENDRVVGGMDPESGERAAAMYRRIVEGEVIVVDATTAELVKLVENASRDVSIAFANEVAQLCREHGVNGREVIALANRHPRVDILQPGPGVGGHCIPVDPWFLISGAPEGGRLIRTAREINDGQPAWIAERTVEEVRDIPDPKVSVWGVAYKGNVDDPRETPALKVISTLEQRGVRVSAVDFHVKRFPRELEDLETSVTGADCILLLTDHREFGFLEPEAIGQRMRHRVLFDTRGCLPRGRWERAGFRVIGL